MLGLAAAKLRRPKSEILGKIELGYVLGKFELGCVFDFEAIMSYYHKLGLGNCENSILL